jgi:hypothetical protein
MFSSEPILKNANRFEPTFQRGASKRADLSGRKVANFLTHGTPVNFFVPGVRGWPAVASWAACRSRTSTKAGAILETFRVNSMTERWKHSDGPRYCDVLGVSRARSRAGERRKTNIELESRERQKIPGGTPTTSRAAQARNVTCTGVV